MIDVEKVKARDLMQADPIWLDAGAAIREAVETFEEYRISGAPVLNEARELVGVLSVSDIARSEHLEGDRVETRHPPRYPEYYSYDPFWDTDETEFWGTERPFGREDYDPEVLGRETVGDWMTPRVVSVRLDATLRQVCQLMEREHIHRVFVLEDRKLLGIISTLDVVSFLARD